jgi:hypothetical protein
MLLLSQGVLGMADNIEAGKSKVSYYSVSLSELYKGKYHIVCQENKDSIVLLMKNIDTKEINYYTVNDAIIKKYNASNQLLSTISKTTNEVDYKTFRGLFLLKEVIRHEDSLYLGLNQNYNDNFKKDTTFVIESIGKLNISTRTQLSINKNAKANVFYFHKIIENLTLDILKYEVEYKLLKKEDALSQKQTITTDMLNDAVFNP